MIALIFAFLYGVFTGLVLYDVVQGEIAVWRARRWLKQHDPDNRDWYDL